MYIPYQEVPAGVLSDSLVPDGVHVELDVVRLVRLVVVVGAVPVAFQRGLVLIVPSPQHDGRVELQTTDLEIRRRKLKRVEVWRKKYKCS